MNVAVMPYPIKPLGMLDNGQVFDMGGSVWMVTSLTDTNSPLIDIARKDEVLCVRLNDGVLRFYGAERSVVLIDDAKVVCRGL